MTKAPTPTKKKQKATWQHKNADNATKHFENIKLRTDLGRSAGETTATPLCGLTGLRALNRNSRVIKRTHI